MHELYNLYIAVELLCLSVMLQTIAAIRDLLCNTLSGAVAASYCDTTLLCGRVTHLIHRTHWLTVVVLACTLHREEIEGVGYNYARYEDVIQRYACLLSSLY
jgi:hypothetical protein